jgi:hypothetical protein
MPGHLRKMNRSNGSNTRNRWLLKIEEPPRPPPARKHRSRWSGRAFQGRILGRPDPTRSVSSFFRGARDCAQKLVRAQEELACVGTGPNSPHIPFNSFVFLPLHHPCDPVGSFSRFFNFFFPLRVHCFSCACCHSRSRVVHRVSSEPCIHIPIFYPDSE